MRAYDPASDRNVAPENDTPENAGYMETLTQDETFGSASFNTAQEFTAGTTGVRGLGWKVSKSEDGEWIEYVPEAGGYADNARGGVGTSARVVFYEIANLVAVLGDPSSDVSDEANFYWHATGRSRRNVTTCVRMRQAAHDEYRQRAASMYLGDVCTDSEDEEEEEEEEESSDSEHSESASEQSASSSDSEDSANSAALAATPSEASRKRSASTQVTTRRQSNRARR